METQTNTCGRSIQTTITGAVDAYRCSRAGFDLTADQVSALRRTIALLEEVLHPEKVLVAELRKLWPVKTTKTPIQ